MVENELHLGKGESEVITPALGYSDYGVVSDDRNCRAFG